MMTRMHMHLVPLLLLLCPARGRENLTTFTPPEVGRICVTNSAGFVLHFDMKDLDSDELSPDSGDYPIDQTKCQPLDDIAHISDSDLILCRVHAVAGETKFCEDAVKYKVNSSETATFVCEGTTLDYSCKLR